MKKLLYFFTSVLFVFVLVSCGTKNIKITFNTNGGTQVRAITIKQLEEIEEPTTTKEGYTFVGWYEDQDFRKEFVFKNGATRNITLYAKWEINRYTISFQTNNDDTVPDITADYQEVITLPTGLEKTGFIFAGWYETADFSKSFTATKMPAQTLTLYAKWDPVTVLVSFYVDGNLVQTRSVNQGNILDDYPEVPSKTGYIGAWSVDPDKVYDADSSVEAIYTIKTYSVKFIGEDGYVYYDFDVDHGDLIPSFSEPEKPGYDFLDYSEDITDLVITKNTSIIVYFKIKMFTVTFRAQGVVLKTESVAYQSYATEPSVDIPGYDFDDWDKDFTKVESNLDVNAILIAKTYQVILNGNGGVFDSEESYILSFSYQSTIRVDQVPIRSGYHFEGWYENEASTGDEVILTGLSMPAHNLVLYAKWELITYKITYQGLFNTQHSNPASYNVNSNITLANPTSRIGYTFTGWYDAEVSGNQVLKLENTTGDKTLYARWDINQYTISFNTDGGSLVDEVTQDYNSAIDIQAIAEPTKLGYSFAGWDQEVPEVMPAANLFIKANWNIVIYDISYDLDGSENHPNNPTSYTVITPTITLEDPEKLGHSFSGWYTDSEFNNQIEEISLGSAGSVSLFAKFVINSYNVLFVNYDHSVIAHQIVLYNTSADTPSDPARNGYEFKRWSKDYSKVTEDLIVEAIYELINYEITYIGLAEEEHLNPSSYDITTEVIFSDPLKAGYEFLGWFENNLLVTKISLGSMGAKTIEARFSLIEYSINYFNLEAGEVHNNPDTYNVTTPTFNLTAPSQIRLGHSFSGWYTDSGLTIPLTSIVKGSVGDLDLYAKITPNAHTITYYIEGKIIGDIEHYNYGDQITIRALQTKHGYSFSWNKELPLTMPDYDIEVEGEFSPISYSITYNLSGGTHSGNPNKYTIESNEIVFNDAVKVGYEFLGWYDAVEDGNLVTAIPELSTGDIVLFALYKAKDYLITFDLAGGTGPETLVVTYDKPFTLDVATKLGYSFTGWTYLDSLFTDGIWQIDNNITLLANYDLDEFLLTISGYQGPVFYPEDITLSGQTDSPLADFITFKWFKDDLLLGSNPTYNIAGVLNSGIYKLVATLDHQGNQMVVDHEIEVVIKKATYDITGISFESKEVVYNGNIQTLEITGNLPTGLTVSYLNNENKNAGTYTVTAVFSGDYDNYEKVDNLTESLIIKKAASVITASDINVEYDGTTYKIEATLNHSQAELLYVDNDPRKDVGIYNVLISVIETDNYLAQEVTKKVTITEKAIDVTANSASKVYGASDPEFTYQVVGLISGDILTGSLTREPGEDVGSYQISQGSLANSNYDITFQGATFTILKASFDMSKISFTDISYVYDTTEKQILITGALPAGLSVEYINNKLTDVGSVEATARFIVADPDNYNLVPEKAAILTITKATYDITGFSFASKEVTYNGDIQSLEITGSLPFGVSVSYLNNENIDADEYLVTAVFSGDYDNYEQIANQTATLTIAKLVIKVTPKSGQSKIFNELDPTLTYNHNPLIAPDEITGSLARQTGEDLGFYEILKGSLAIDSNNYLIDFVSGVYFEITPASLDNVNLEGRTVTYNKEPHSLVVTGAPLDAVITYYVEGVAFAGIPAFVDVGTYNISAVVEKVGYTTVNLPEKALVITKKAASISADDQEITYNDPDVALTVTITGLISGDLLNYDITREPGNQAGSYLITVSLGANPNYDVTPSTGTYKILKAASVITASDINVEYDGTTYKIEATLNHSEAELLFDNNDPRKDVGTYSVIISVIETDNYLAQEVTKKVKITEKAIDVTANSASKIYGASDPEFTYQVVGLISGDTLTGSLTRSPGEDVGSYQINQGSLANSNYSINFQTADFVINQRALTIKIDNQTTNRLEPLAELTYQITSGSIVFSDNLGLSITTNADIEVSGTYDITGSYTNTNYDITFADGVYTVKALEYEVKFYVGDILYHSEVVIENTVVDKPADPEKDDYTFAAWYTDEGFNNVFAFNTLINQNYQLYANFNINQYTITFNSAGGSEVSSITADFDSLISPPDNPNRAGYSFAGWNPALPERMPSGGLDVVALWTAIKYTITFDSAGGSQVAPITQDYDTLIDPPQDPNKEGYTFAGWNPELPSKMPLGGLEVVAEWVAINYTITFNSAGGSEVSSITQGYQTTITPPANPSKLGYTFINWNPALPEKMPLGGLDLTAIWQLDIYSITYHLDEGTNHPNNPATYTLLDEKINLLDASKIGYTFAGWYSAITGGSKISEIQQGSTGDLDLFARYNLREYTITYYVDGVKYGDEQRHFYGSPITILAEPTKTGYTFSGWDIESFPETMPAENLNIYGTYTINQYEVKFVDYDGIVLKTQQVDYGLDATAPVNPDNKEGYHFTNWDKEFTNITDDLVVNALYSPNVYVVSFDTGDDDINVTFDQAYTNLPEPTKTGYTFVGWYDNAGFTGDIITNQTIVKKASNHALYASFSANTYKITFYYNDATSGNEVEDKDVVYDEDYGILPEPERIGYNFLGWYKDSLEGALIESDTKVTTASNHSLHAKWEIKVYTVRFKDYDGEVLKTQQVNHGSDATAPANDPERYGYTFTGWSVSFTNVVSDLDVEAEYEIIKYSVVFKKHDGTDLEIQIVDHGSTATLPNEPVNNGYKFLAWYIDIELANIYDFNDEVTQDLILYPAWEIESYTWEVISIFKKEDLEDPGIVTFDPDQDPITREYINLYYNSEINPVLSYEGYIFDYFVYDGDEYPDIDALIAVKGNTTIEVYYRKIILTITFAQDPDLFDSSEDAIREYRIYYNDTFEIPEDLLLVEPEPDPDFGSWNVFWDRTQFINVKENLVVYAIYHLIGVKTVIFSDSGVVKYIAQAMDEIGEPIDEVIARDSILWDMKKAGYKFLGWFTAEEGGEQIIQEEEKDLLFEDFADLTTTLYARWEKLTSFSAPKDISISISEQVITISWTLDPATINELEPSGFAYLFNNNLITDLDTKPVLVGTKYTLTFNPENPEYNLFADLLNPGTHELRIRALGDNENHYQSGYSAVKTYSLESIYEEEPTEVAVYDYFIIESFGDTKRYVFYTNLNYQFAENYTFEIITGHEIVSTKDNIISTKGISGSFRFRMIKEGEAPKVYDALVVHDIKQFAIGDNYQNYLNAKQTAQTTFLKEAENYYVGNANEFHLDLRLVNNKGQRIPLSQTYLEYELYYENNGNYQKIIEAELEDHLEILPNNSLKLTEAALGNKYKLVVKPRYQASSMEVADAEFEFVVNNGVNVYTNQQLKDAYSDFNVKAINIHASFNAELLSNQKNTDGSPINRRPTTGNPTTGNVYQRFNPAIDDDAIVIEGNYMTIDGSNLPYANADSGSGAVGFAQAFEIVNMQIGIFYYGMGPNEGAVNNSGLTLNNLIIKGNTSTPYVDFSGSAEDIEIQERLMSRNSGGYMGFFIHGGEFVVDNVVILNTVIAISNNSYSYKDEELLEPNYVEVNYLKTYNNWANTLYLHTALGIIIKDSYIGQSGGSAIHMVDTMPAEFDEQGNKLRDPSPYLYLDETTTVNNWISGEEAWFKAYGMTQVALTLKSSIQQGIALTGRSIIKDVKNPISGLETEMINFILLTEPSDKATKKTNSETPVQISGSEVIYELDGNHIRRPFDFFADDPRVIEGQFAFPIGEYSEWGDFYSLIGEITLVLKPNYPPETPIEIIQEAASNLAPLAAFYGLSAEQAATAYGVAQQQQITFREAVQQEYPDHSFPRFLEVLAPVPVFDSGYSHVIIEFAD